MTTQKSHQNLGFKIDMIRAVKTPLGFFSLVVLVVEVILGITANLSQGTDRTYLIIGMLVLIFLLVFIVTGLALYRPEALIGVRPNSRPITLDHPSSLPAIETIQKPSLLVASSSQEYVDNYLESDIKIISEVFPKRQIDIYKGITSSKMRDILTDKYYDILHLTVPVEKDIGALKFGEEDIMDAEAFSKLLEICNAKLVIFAVCDSLTAGARIARKTNIIVAIDTIGDEMVQEWERTFYKLFSRGHSLSRAYDIARTTTSTQMVLLMKNDLTIISE